MTSNAKGHRRSLKECLKSVLQRRRDDDHLITGSGILKREDPSFTLLPSFTSLSTLPGFGQSKFDIDQYSVSIPDRPDSVATRIWAADHSQSTITSPSRSTSSCDQQDLYEAYQCQSDLGRLAQKCSQEQDWYAARDTLSHVSKQFNDDDELDLARIEAISSKASSLRTTSLEKLATSDAIHFQSPLSQLAYACNVPSIYRHGASLSASLATLRSPNPSASTLRLQRSTRDLRPSRVISPVPQPTCNVPSHPSATPYTVSNSDNLPLSRRKSSGSLPHRTPAAGPSSGRQAEHTQLSSEVAAGLASINHFSSFCVLDAATPGCPVTATSQDLRLVVDIGEQFCVSTASVEGATMDTVTGQDANGRTVIHLVVYSPLVNPNSGRSRFVLASLLDITAFITDAASLPELETISEESFIEDDLQTPPRVPMPYSPTYQLSAEDLIDGNCLLDCKVHTPAQPISRDDVWLDIASEESRRSRSIKSVPSATRSSSCATSSSTQSMNDVLDQFIASLQDLYSEFFLLGKSPLDEDSYEICNVSPRVHQSREYIHGHLTQTPAADMAHLEQQLTQDRSFRIRVSWGAAGDLKQLFCIPLFGRSNITWVCFLVEEAKWAGLWE